jgi:hypothetical protein
VLTVIVRDGFIWYVINYFGQVCAGPANHWGNTSVVWHVVNYIAASDKWDINRLWQLHVIYVINCWFQKYTVKVLSKQDFNIITWQTKLNFPVDRRATTTTIASATSFGYNWRNSTGNLQLLTLINKCSTALLNQCTHSLSISMNECKDSRAQNVLFLVYWCSDSNGEGRVILKPHSRSEINIFDGVLAELNQ